jgi:hypothetical protein
VLEEASDVPERHASSALAIASIRGSIRASRVRPPARLQQSVFIFENASSLGLRSGV